MQINTSETGSLCVFINNITLNKGLSENMMIKNLFLRYLITFTFLLIGPVIIIPIGIALATIGSPLFLGYQIYLVYRELRNSCKNICLQILKYTIGLLFILLFLIIIDSCIAVIFLIVATLGLILFYIVLLILILRTPFQHCCKTKQSSNA